MIIYLDKMKFATEIRALDPFTLEMKTWCGEHIEANSFEEAKKWCKENKGWLKVVGRLIAEADTEEDGITPNWDTYKDYENE